MDKYNSAMASYPSTDYPEPAPAFSDLQVYEQERPQQPNPLHYQDKSQQPNPLQYQDKSLYSDDQTPKGQILGLSVKAFWLTVGLAVLVLAIGIGIGLGVGLSAQARRGGDSPAPRENDTQTTTASSTPSAASSTSTPAPSSSPTRTAPVVGLVSPAPVDGCPDTNGTSYQPLDPRGQPYGERYVRLCSTHYSANVPENRLFDLMRAYAASLDDCITLCAGFNANYRTNMRDRGFPASGLCRSVAIAKSPGNYCWLKNGTGTLNTASRNDDPDLISSGVLLLDA